MPQNTTKDIILGLSVNLIYDILKYIFILFIMYISGKLGFNYFKNKKNMNKKIEIGENVIIEDSFKSKKNENIIIKNKVGIKNSFHSDKNKKIEIGEESKISGSFNN